MPTIIGSFGQGIGVGASSGNSTAASAEFEPGGDKKRAAQRAGAALFSGLALGPIVSGLIADFLPRPTVLVYILGTALLLAYVIGKANDRRASLPHYRASIWQSVS